MKKLYLLLALTASSHALAKDIEIGPCEACSEFCEPSKKYNGKTYKTINACKSACMKANGFKLQACVQAPTRTRSSTSRGGKAMGYAECIKKYDKKSCAPLKGRR